MTKFLNNKNLTIVLLASFVFLSLFVWTTSRSNAALTSNIVYFVPKEAGLMEKEFSPATFNNNRIEQFTYINQIESTSNWQAIQKLAAERQLDVLIIHHEAQTNVPWEEVKGWFQDDGVVVAGIGVAGDQLAAQLGAPSLYIEQGADEMDFDYFIYALEIEGQPEDEQKLVDAGFDSEQVERIHASLSVSKSASRGFLSGSQMDTMSFLGSINGLFIEKNHTEDK